MYKNNVEMRILINGRPIKEYSHNGMQFIESRHGSNYSIKIKNDNAHRVMAVVSVDGLDVISGKPAEKTDKGYIVDAYSSTEIKGYRLSDTERADFMFVSKDSKKNYVASAQGGDKRNSGVIGIRVFEEKPEKVKVVEKVKEVHHWHNNPVYPIHPWNPYYPPHQPYWYTLTGVSVGGTTYRTNTGSDTVANIGGGGSVSSNFCNVSSTDGTPVAYTAATNTGDLTRGLKKSGGAGGQSVNLMASSANSFDSPIQSDSFDTGTGWGKKNTDVVKKEMFRKGKMVAELVLYYATTDALVGMGIDLSTTPKIAEVPKAFGKGDYCQPPKGWNG